MVISKSVQILARPILLSVLSLTVVLSSWANIAVFAKSTYSKIPTEAFTTAPNDDVPENLDDVFIFPNKSSIKFDPASWKEHESRRVYMLFDLYHQPLSRYGVEQIYDMLGRPNESRHFSPGATVDIVTYDLGFLNGSRAMLDIHFDKGKVRWLSLKRKSSNFAPLATGIWQRTNMSWSTYADELNRQMFIVGTPLRLLPAALGYGRPVPISTSGKQRINSVEFEPSDDGLKVKQFRVFYLNNAGVEESTPWESTDRHKAISEDSRFLVRESEIRNLQQRKNVYLQPYMPFSSQQWKNFQQGYIGFRLAMISSLVRTYPLIGMTRSEINQLLGETSISIKDVFQPDGVPAGASEFLTQNPPGSANMEVYQLSPPHCGNSGSHSFELKFQDDRVVAYRFHYNAGISINQGDSTGALFGFPKSNSETSAP